MATKAKTKKGKASVKPSTFAQVQDWFDDEEESQEREEYSLTEYDITASPNDFNTITIFNFIKSGAVKIPAFQRHYVWDIRRASKLIESLIMGIPIPQVFLYEDGKNSFLVVDGQQRLMSLYYFMQERFPRKEKRSELRRLFDQRGGIPPEALADEHLFEPFELQLPLNADGAKSQLMELKYSTLGEYKTSLDLRTIRNIIIKQNTPKNDDSSIHEIFNRLNTGGVNLAPQEIRASLYHSRFYESLYKLNADRRWRALTGQAEPDLRMKDIEILLRGFAMLIAGPKYRAPMAQFLNHFSKKMKDTDVDPKLLTDIFDAFLDKFATMPEKPFFGFGTGRFNISTFEAVFAAVTQESFAKNKIKLPEISTKKMKLLREDSEFAEATASRTTDPKNVKTRLRRAKEILLK